ncbi:unnamed protein product, partial [Candidula unifasciata]
KSKKLSSSLVTFEEALELAVHLRDIEAETLIRKTINNVHDMIWKRELRRQITDEDYNAPSEVAK